MFLLIEQFTRVNELPISPWISFDDAAFHANQPMSQTAQSSNDIYDCWSAARIVDLLSFDVYAFHFIRHIIFGSIRRFQSSSTFEVGVFSDVLRLRFSLNVTFSQISSPWLSLRNFNKLANMIRMKRTLTNSRAFLDGPAMIAPPGMHHNFFNPTNQRTAYRSVVIFCLILSVLAVSMRMWTKIRVVRKVFLEDCKSAFFHSKSLPEVPESR